MIVYPADNHVIARCVEASGYRGRRVAWSATDPRAALYVKNISKTGTTTTVTYIYKGIEARYELPFIDEASVENSITCAAVALHIGLSHDTLATRMAAIEPVAMRLEVKEGRHGCTLINDSYNSDINSLDIALDFMNRRPDHAGRRRTLILSDICQLSLIHI